MKSAFRKGLESILKKNVRKLTATEHEVITKKNPEDNSIFCLIENQWAYYFDGSQCYTYLLVADGGQRDLTEGTIPSLYKQFNEYGISKISMKSKRQKISNPLRHSIIGPTFSPKGEVSIKKIEEEIKNWIKSLSTKRSGNKRELRELSVKLDQKPASKKRRKTKKTQLEAGLDKKNSSANPDIIAEIEKLLLELPDVPSSDKDDFELRYLDFLSSDVKDSAPSDQCNNSSFFNVYDPEKPSAPLDEIPRDEIDAIDHRKHISAEFFNPFSYENSGGMINLSEENCNGPVRFSLYIDGAYGSDTSDQDGDEIHENKTEDNGEFPVPPLVVI